MGKNDNIENGRMLGHARVIVPSECPSDGSSFLCYVYLGCGASSSAEPLDSVVVGTPHAPSTVHADGHPSSAGSVPTPTPSPPIPPTPSKTNNKQQQQQQQQLPTPTTKSKRLNDTTSPHTETRDEDHFDEQSSSPPLRPLPDPLRSAESSTQIGGESHKTTNGSLPTLGGTPARHSHSSKLDLVHDHHPANRDMEHEKQEILSKVLVCRNCEDIHLPLAVWCSDCHRVGDEAPPVFCATCNTDLHQFVKTRQHVRASLSQLIHSTRMKTAAELGLPGTLLPPGLPPLETLACSNCDAEPNVQCTDCKTILCTNCARDIHNPKLMRSHLRHPLTQRYITVGFNAAAKAHDPPSSTTNAKSGESSLTQKPSFGKMISANSLRASGATPPTSKTYLPSSSPQPPLKARSVVKHRVRSTETTDIVPYENVGVPGDVYVFGDPAITGALNEMQLEFRNVINPYDTIGSVQIVSISCGTDHCGAVTLNGSLFMWGSNVESQLGCGSALGSERWSRDPLLIEFPRHAPVKQVACGAVHTLALCQDSTVWSWGEGKMGKLGHVSDADCEVPTLVELGHWGPRGEDETQDMSGDEEVVYIACGQNNSGCIVKGRKDQYQLYLWGEGASGQIPQTHLTSSASASAPASSSSTSPSTSTSSSSPSSSLLPKLLPQLVSIHVPEHRTDPFPELTTLAFGTKHVAVTSKAGSVWTWGDNSFGQCGYFIPGNDGDNSALQLTPRLVPKLHLDGVKAKLVTCGERHTSILSHSGDIWSFGSGESHQLGVMDNVDQFQPVRAVGVGAACNLPMKHLAVGAAISVAVSENGQTYMWGYGVETPTPQLVEGLRGKSAQAVDVGANANIAVLTGSSADLYEWQFDGAPLDAEETHGTAAGEAGLHDDDDNANASSTDDPPAGGKGVPTVNRSLRGKRITAMSSGKNHYIVVTGDGKAYAWGSNYAHETGLKLPSEISYVPAPLELKFPDGAAIVDVKCGVEHSIALNASGQVYTWGTGFEGRLGHVANSDVPEPKLVQSLVDSKVTAKSIAIGPSNTAVIAKDGGLYIWGAGNGGQCGNEDLMPAFKPTLVKTFIQLKEKVTAIALGNYHACAITESKQVYAWGDNKFFQCGQGPSFQEDYAAYPLPVTSFNVLQLSPIQVECGDNVCMVLTASGELYGWGTGETQQLCRKAAPVDGEADNDDEFNAGSEDVHTPVRLQFPFQKAGNSQKPSNSTSGGNCLDMRFSNLHQLSSLVVFFSLLLSRPHYFLLCSRHQLLLFDRRFECLGLGLGLRSISDTSQSDQTGANRIHAITDITGRDGFSQMGQDHARTYTNDAYIIVNTYRRMTTHPPFHLQDYYCYITPHYTIVHSIPVMNSFNVAFSFGSFDSLRLFLSNYFLLFRF